MSSRRAPIPPLMLELSKLIVQIYRRQTMRRAFASFLVEKEREMGEHLSLAKGPDRLSTGWVFYYQSRAYVETSSINEMLVGHGPVIVADDGRVIEGSSMDRDPEEMLKR
ncbi:MAG: hypothetical protein B7Y36_06905 [Novosphingobium sp. 28-62-57]|nr:MAG: hypothetical protein B7Z34_02115 [Novosphingobium sp. 12-62-10]OYZ11089.1 MAG: hypothetical protein B7Y36_06905 [Novosphingobium sp. 28-62-57]OZA39079.1 MAG: hypothetical protein B7X92_03300 [Novosphingobium sp. 17-62-9]